MNIYISGPIEGVDNYREKFERAKRIIEKRRTQGYQSGRS